MTPILSVLITSYNSSATIGRAIESVLNQKTNFKFNVVIIDDGSTDESVFTIRGCISFNKNPNASIVFIPMEHRGMMPTFIVGLNQCNRKYVAICDGDDRWIDENKLQLQFDYLESHPECGMVHTGVKVENEAGELEKLYHPIEPNTITYDTLLRGCPIYSCSVMFRRSHQLFDAVFAEMDKFYIWDYPIWLWIAHESEIHYLSNVTSCHVKYEESFTNTKNRAKRLRHILGLFSIKWYFMTKIGYKPVTFILVVYQLIKDLASILFNRWHK